MIRREITLPDGTKLWLLISQVEHARVSGELARHWHEEFTPEVIDAVTHHDDGWADWESEPRLNPAVGAPYSFFEMPLAEALSIWDKSIAAARQFGPLAAYIVAGHFYSLLDNSDHAQEGIAVAWLTAQRKVRTAWLDEWIRADRSQTLDVAKQAQQMLQLTDLFSLWLCCDCPIDAGQASILAQSAMKLRTGLLHGQFRFDVRECLAGQSVRAGHWTGFQWTIAVEPNPFRQSPLLLDMKLIAAPARRYESWRELVEASWSAELRWRLIPATSAAELAE